MSKTVTITLATVKKSFPAGTKPQGGIVFSLGSLAPITCTVEPYTASFSPVDPGSYIATFQAVDAEGAAVDSPVTFALVVPDDSVIYNIPDAAPGSVTVEIK